LLLPEGEPFIIQFGGGLEIAELINFFDIIEFAVNTWNGQQVLEIYLIDVVKLRIPGVGNRREEGVIDNVKLWADMACIKVAYPTDRARVSSGDPQVLTTPGARDPLGKLLSILKGGL
jgi:hypothetical protein